MKQSQLFTKTRKEAPADEQAKNAQLLIRAGFIHKEMAGAYDLLPLGQRVVEKIKSIIREEMNKIGGQELIMTSLQNRENWTQTNRWDDEAVDVWFKSDLHAGGQVGFGWSHEEPITIMMKNHIASFRDLPAYVYQFQTKMRNELRAKSGIMRGREFVMKDLYSYSADEDQHNAFYSAVTESYLKIFERLGIGDETFVTFAAGGAFTEFSHEFQTICPTGEDVTYINKEKNIAINEEVLSEKALADLGIVRDDLEEVKTAEVGNIFNFGTHKCEQLGLFYTNDSGEKAPVHLGSYGIGVTRVMGVIVELFNDKNGIIWPDTIAPYQIHIVGLGKNDKVYTQANALYMSLLERNFEVLYDDRQDLGIGAKLADADLIGCTYRVVVSERSLEKNSYEVRRRNASESTLVKTDKIFDFLDSQ